MNLFINGFRGLWAWIPDFEQYVKNHHLYKHKIEIVDNPNDADIIFQADMTDWRRTSDCLSLDHQTLIVNVLDLAEWVQDVDENKELLSYLKFADKEAKHITAISPKVIYQLSMRGFDAQMFYYPSIVKISDLSGINLPLRKRQKVLFSYGRLADPGKDIKTLTTLFSYHDLYRDGWRYVLCGPEKPLCGLSQGIIYLGYLQSDQLVEFIKNSAFVLQWSHGEGLGLQPIEASLLKTAFVAKKISPLTDLWGDTQANLTDYDVLDNWFKSLKDINFGDDFINKKYDYIVNQCYNLAFPWLRENAFERLIAQLFAWQKEQ